MNPTEQFLRSIKRRSQADLAMQIRLAEVSNPNSGERTAEIVWTTGAAVNRIDPDTGAKWIEELSCDPAAVRMGRMKVGCPLLDTHNRYSVTGILGVVENAKVDGSKGTATVRFSKRAEVEPIFQDVKDRIIRNVSVGYKVYKYDDVSTPDDLRDGKRRMRATDWEPSEVSLVPVGADANAGVRSASMPKGVLLRSVPSFRSGVRDSLSKQPQPVKATVAEMHQLRLKKQELLEKGN